jgi:hypothetical protein
VTVMPLFAEARMAAGGPRATKLGLLDRRRARTNHSVASASIVPRALVPSSLGSRIALEADQGRRMVSETPRMWS